MKSLIRYLVGMLIVLVVTTLVLPGWLGVKYPMPSIPSFDPRIRMEIVDDLESQQPEIVLMGNSSLAYGVDVSKFGELSGRSTYAIINSGSGTALWYLILKNNIAISTFKPTTLVIFFTETSLTNPGDLVTGKYFPIIDEYASSNEALLIKLSYQNRMTVFEKAFQSGLPLYGYRESISESLKDFVEYFLTNALLNCPAVCMQGTTEEVFQHKNLLPNLINKPTEATLMTSFSWKNLNFDTRVSQSFLPEMIHICRENNIQLIMVRMGTRKFLSVADEPPWVRSYFRALKNSLESHGVGFLDLAYDRRITPNLYFEYFHLSEAGRKIFTRILTESINPMLK